MPRSSCRQRPPCLPQLCLRVRAPLASGDQADGVERILGGVCLPRLFGPGRCCWPQAPRWRSSCGHMFDAAPYLENGWPQDCSHGRRPFEFLDPRRGVRDHPHPERSLVLGGCYPRAATLSWVMVSKSLASWRSCNCSEGSPEARFTIRPRLTAGRPPIASAQRRTCR